jgi:hypothetical protein
MCVNGTAKTARLIEHTTQGTSLFNYLNSITDALQYMVYSNCAMKISETIKYIL